MFSVFRLHFCTRAQMSEEGEQPEHPMAAQFPTIDTGINLYVSLDFWLPPWVLQAHHRKNCLFCKEGIVGKICWSCRDFSHLQSVVEENDRKQAQASHASRWRPPTTQPTCDLCELRAALQFCDSCFVHTCPRCATVNPSARHRGHLLCVWCADEIGEADPLVAPKDAKPNVLEDVE